MPALWNEMSTAPKWSTAGFEEMLDLLRFAHVDRHEAPAHGVGRRRTRAGIEIGDHHARAFGRQAVRRCQADPARATRDHGDATREPRLRGARSHGSAPSR